METTAYDAAVREIERLQQINRDLLAALEGIVADDSKYVSLADQRSRWNERMDAARAAIAKAQGS